MEGEEGKSIHERLDNIQKVKKMPTILAFGAIGFLVDFFFSITISASQDILQGTEISTSVVLLASSAPACVSTLLYPYVSKRTPVLVAPCGIFLSGVTGMLLTALVTEPKVKLIGVCLTSFGYRSAEAVFCALIALHGQGKTMNSYALGSGTSFLAAPLFYIGLTMVAGLSPQVSLLLLTTLWILVPLSYIAIARNESNRNHAHPTTYKEVPYSPVESSNTFDTPKLTLSPKDMLTLVWKSIVGFIALLTSIISKMLLVNAVVTTIAFNDISITPRNQYLFYVLASGIGDFTGRPFLLYLSWCGVEDKFTIRKTWILAFINVLILIFMVFVSWFRFLSDFSAGVALVMMNALLSGVVCANSFRNAGEDLHAIERMFCRALMAGALWIGNICVALIGLDTEARLREHCMLNFPEGTCFTRSLT